MGRKHAQGDGRDDRLDDVPRPAGGRNPKQAWALALQRHAGNRAMSEVLTPVQRAPTYLDDALDDEAGEQDGYDEYDDYEAEQAEYDEGAPAPPQLGDFIESAFARARHDERAARRAAPTPEVETAGFLPEVEGGVEQGPRPMGGTTLPYDSFREAVRAGRETRARRAQGPAPAVDLDGALPEADESGWKVPSRPEAKPFAFKNATWDEASLPKGEDGGGGYGPLTDAITGGRTPASQPVPKAYSGRPTPTKADAAWHEGTVHERWEKADHPERFKGDDRTKAPPAAPGFVYEHEQLGKAGPKNVTKTQVPGWKQRQDALLAALVSSGRAKDPAVLGAATVTKKTMGKRQVSGIDPKRIEKTLGARLTASSDHGAVTGPLGHSHPAHGGQLSEADIASRALTGLRADEVPKDKTGKKQSHGMVNVGGLAVPAYKLGKHPFKETTSSGFTDLIAELSALSAAYAEAWQATKKGVLPKAGGGSDGRFAVTSGSFATKKDDHLGFGFRAAKGAPKYKDSLASAQGRSGSVTRFDQDHANTVLKPSPTGGFEAITHYPTKGKAGISKRVKVGGKNTDVHLADTFAVPIADPRQADEAELAAHLKRSDKSKYKTDDKYKDWWR